jgi:hypothetical protein
VAICLRSPWCWARKLTHFEQWRSRRLQVDGALHFDRGDETEARLFGDLAGATRPRAAVVAELKKFRAAHKGETGDWAIYGEI